VVGVDCVGGKGQPVNLLRTHCGRNPTARRCVVPMSARHLLSWWRADCCGVANVRARFHW